MQLGDHYGFAAELSNQIDDNNGRTNTVEENHKILAARQAAFEQEMLEGFNTAERATNCVSYGLTEMGGFTRYASVTTDQPRHMMTQKKATL